MKRKLLIALLVMFLFTAEAYASENKVNKLGGIKDLEYKSLPYIITVNDESDILMVPLRETMERLGYEVKWSPGTGTVTVEKGYLKASLRAGYEEYYNKKNEPIKLNMMPVNKNGVCYVPNMFFDKVLEYDSYILGDTFYIKNRVEGIKPGLLAMDKQVSGSEGGGIKSVRIICPELTSSAQQKVNKIIRYKLEKLIDRNSFDKLELKYDVAFYGKNILSLVFTGEMTKGENTRSVFEAINVNLKDIRPFEVKDFVIDVSSKRNYIVKQVEAGGSIRVEFDKLQMYFVNDAVIFYQNDVNSNKVASKYFKIEDISDIISTGYSFIINE